MVISSGSAHRSAVIVDEVPVGRLASDGKTLLPLDGAALKERRRIMFNGSVVATLVLNPQGRLAAPPAITVIGLVEPGAAGGKPFLRDARRAGARRIAAGRAAR